MAGLGTKLQPQAAPADMPMEPGAPAAGPDTPLPAAAEEGQEAAREEEQFQYEAFVKRMVDMVYPPDKQGTANPEILNNLQGKFNEAALALFEQSQPPLTDSILDSTAATAVVVTMMVEQSIKQELDDGTFYPEGFFEEQPGEEEIPVEGNQQFTEQGEEGEEEEDDFDPDELSDAVVYHGGKAVVEELIEIAEAAKLHEFSEQDMETVTYRAVDLYRIASPRADPVALTEAFKEVMAADKAGQLGSVLPGLPGGPPMPQKAA